MILWNQGNQVVLDYLSFGMDVFAVITEDPGRSYWAVLEMLCHEAVMQVCGVILRWGRLFAALQRRNKLSENTVLCVRIGHQPRKVQVALKNFRG